MIETFNVEHAYNNEPVIRGVSIKIKKGITLFRGPNGSGKTTMAKIISGLLRPTKGRVMVDNIDIYSGDSKASEKLREIVFIHDTPVILKGNVYRNLTYGLRIMGKTNYTVLSELIERFGLKRLVHKNTNELSAGEKQIVSLVRGLAVSPKYLILDEPLQYLDDERRRQVISYLLELRDLGVTIVIATHEHVLMKYADKIFYIKYGYVEEVEVLD